MEKNAVIWVANTGIGETVEGTIKGSISTFKWNRHKTIEKSGYHVYGTSYAIFYEISNALGESDEELLVVRARDHNFTE